MSYKTNDARRQCTTDAPVRDLSYSLAHFRELALIKEKAIETANADKVTDKLELGNKVVSKAFATPA